MASRFHIHFVCFFLSVSMLCAQPQIDQAELLMQDLRYSDALNILNNYQDLSDNSKGLQLRGTCHYHLNQLDEAILDYTAAKKQGNDSPDLFLKMGDCKRHLKSFEEAVFFYKSFLTQVGNNHADSYTAYNEIKNALFCATAKDSSDILVQNFGDRVNTEYDELQIVQSPQYGNVYYLSSNKEGIFFKLFSHYIDSLGRWQESPVNAPLNNEGIYVQDISANGNNLLIKKQSPDYNTNKILVSSYRDQQEHLFTLPDSQLQDATDIQFVNRNTIAFASNQPGGFGGYDIYTMTYVNGQWQKAQNLGPLINTSHDERSPFLSADMQSLYFSSRRPYCYGGFDIYLATDLSQNVHIKNLGPTVNSPGDDLGFRICKDGLMATFYSDRKTGNGGFDAYFAYMRMVPFDLYRDSLDLSYVQDYHNKRIYTQQEKLVVSKDEQNQEASIDSTNIIEDELAPTPQTDKEVTTSFEPEPQPEEVAIPFEPAPLPEEVAAYILYQDKQDLLDEHNTNKLRQWIGYLRENLDVHIKLLAYTDHLEPGLPEFVQYNTMKRATYVADYLIENGVDPKRIHIESLAANYPVVKQNSAGRQNDAFLKYNKRIDLELTDNNGQTLSSFLMDEMVPEYAYDPRHELFLSIREDLYYSVEIAHTNRLFKNAVLRLYSDIYVRKEDMSQENKYYIGLYTTLDEAKSLQFELLQSSAPSAKIVAFYNGMPVNKSNYHLVVKYHPEIADLGIQ